MLEDAIEQQPPYISDYSKGRNIIFSDYFHKGR